MEEGRDIWADERQIELGPLLDNFVSHAFNDLFKLLDEDSGQDSQRQALMKRLFLMFRMGAKYRIVFQFVLR